MSTYWGRLLDALAGRTVAGPPQPAPAVAPVVSKAEADLEARVRSLQMDLEDRDRRIDAMRQEYASLESASERASTDTGNDTLERLFKKLAGPMSNLATLAELSEAGNEVPAADLIALVRSVEKELARCGMERVGRPGADAPFDTALHQRMSGGAVHAGTLVTVRVPGYRIGDRILWKAMVSAREGTDG